MGRGRVETVAGVAVTAVVAVIGAAAGFTHTHDAALVAGQAGWLAWADALVIECLVIVAGYQMHRYRKAGQRVGFPATVLVVAFLVQMGAQVSGAPRTAAGWLFAAMPALGCLVVIKLVSRSIEPGDRPAEPRVQASAVRNELLPQGQLMAELPLERDLVSWPPQR
jgi:peptidoglycan/LPS O-acetylase OafA/YrhL